MDRPYVEELRIQGYGCIRDATFRLTPLHALIGPNDSGKSTVLRALRTLGAITGPIYDSPETRVLERALVMSVAPDGQRFDVSVATTTWRIEIDPRGSFRDESWTRGGQPMIESGTTATQMMMFGSIAGLHVRPAPDILHALRGIQLLRLDPDALRASHPLIPDSEPLRFADERGTGLPALYDSILSRNLPAYMAVNEELARLFPSVKSIQLANPSTDRKAIGVRLTDGTVVPAELMSEGMLYYLAFAALPYLDPTALLLIEEPENGLHPARIAEVMRVLRAISEKTQVVIATDSPLVVNELQPEEVTVVTRTHEHGTKATRMAETPNFDERAKVYALGELWLSYANGTDEAPLLQGGPRS